MSEVGRAVGRLARAMPDPCRHAVYRLTPGRLREPISRALGIGGARTFQETYLGLEERWRLVSPLLPQDPAWVLDIGANLGDTARRAAAMGHTVIGVEVSRSLVLRASESAPPRVAFMAAKVTPELLHQMPRFATVFLFSVLHRIWALQGREVAENCLQACMAKTPCLLVEGAVRHERYMDKGHAPPEFESNDLDQGVEWHLEWFQRLAPGSGWKVTHLGSVPSSPSEPHRPVFALEEPGRRPGSQS